MVAVPTGAEVIGAEVTGAELTSADGTGEVLTAGCVDAPVCGSTVVAVPTGAEVISAGVTAGAKARGAEVTGEAVAGSKVAGADVVGDPVAITVIPPPQPQHISLGEKLGVEKRSRQSARLSL